MNKLIEEYLQRGFGSMNKNDFEVAIFNEILKEQDYASYSDFDFSRKFKIPETKVRRLRYEAELKYGKPNYRRKFLEIILKMKLPKNSDMVQLLVPDKSLREYINDIMRKSNVITDGCFNSDILKIDLGDLCELIEAMFTEDEKMKLLEILKNVETTDVDANKNDNYKLKDYVLNFLTGVTSSVVGNLIMLMF